MSEFLLATLQRIEDNQKEHNHKLDIVNNSVIELATKQEGCIDIQADHEQRIRRSETVIIKVTTFFAGASVIFGSIVAWAVDKLLSVGN